MLRKDQAEKVLTALAFGVIAQDNFWVKNLPPTEEIMVPDFDIGDFSIVWAQV